MKQGFLGGRQSTRHSMPMKIGLACLLCCIGSVVTSTVLANPEGGKLQYGQASITSQGNTLQIQQNTNKAVINWKTFNIQSNETTRIHQPSSHAILLNRANPNFGASQILGHLSANGQVWIINPAGILFGANAHVDVAGLVATTANISTRDFVAGNYHFVQSPKWHGGIVNEGTISIKDAGVAALVAPGVENSGIINARLGTVVLGAAREFTLDFYGDQLLNFKIQSEADKPGIDPRTKKAMQSGVDNSGKILADGGTVIVSAKTASGILDSSVNMSGVISAKSVSEKNGVIILSGDDNAPVRVSGKLIASGNRHGQTGGTIKILGKNIKITDHAVISVTGDKGGGDIVIGGEAHGQGTTPRANTTYVGPLVTIDASALTSGNGGNVVVWSDQQTEFYGSIFAKGGQRSGNGGWIETSGGYLDVNGAHVDTTAAHGQVGSWLLDPTNIWIASSSANAQRAGDPTNDQSANTASGNTLGATNTTSDSFLATATLNAALASSDIIVTTSNTSGTSSTGNITVVNGISWSSTHSLTLTAGNNITITGNIATGAAGSTLILNAAGNVSQVGIISGSGGVTQAGSGTVTFSKSNTYTGPTIVNAGGTLSITNSTAIKYSSRLTVNNGGTLNINGISISATNAPATFNLNGTGVSGNGALTGTGSASYAGPIALASNSTVAVAAGNTLTLSGIISGPGSLIMQGPGTLAISGTNNNYSGGTIFNGGTVSIAADLGLGAAPASVNPTNLIFNGGTLAATASFTLNSNRGITLTGAGSIAPATTKTVSYAGIITGSGALTMSGAGTLSLSGNNTNTGGMNFNAGMVSIISDANLGAIPISFSAANLTFNGGTLITTNSFTLNGNRGITLLGTGTVAPANGTTLTYAGTVGQSNLSGAGAFIMNGAGTLALTGGNTNSGTFTMSTGTVCLKDAKALGSSSVITVSSGTLSLNLGGTTLANTNTIKLNGAGINNRGALFESGTTGIDILNNNIILASATGIGVANGGTLELGSTGDVISSTGTNTLTINQSGTTGNLIINSSTNTYTGNTIINAGIVTITKLAPLSTASSLGAPTSGGSGTITLGSAGNSATLINTDSSASPSSNRTINTAGTGGSGTFDWAGSNTLALTGAINNAGTGGMTIETTGAGSLTLASGTITNTNGLTLFASTANISASNGITNTGGIIINGSYAVSLTGNISGAGGLTSNLTSTLTLGGSNSLTGAMMIHSGQLIATTNTNALGSATNHPSSITIDNGAELDINGLALTSTSPLTLNGSGTNAALYLRSGTSGKYAGAITLGSDTTIGALAGGTLTLSGGISNINNNPTLTFAGAGNFAITNIISNNNGNLGITMTSTGTLTLSQANTFSGNTQIVNGIVIITHAGALGSGTITVGTNASSTATLKLNFGAGTLTNTNSLTLYGNGNGNNGALIGTSASAETLNNTMTLGSNVTIGNSSTGLLTLGGNINDASQHYSLTLAGSGSIELDGTNSYAGGTILNGITLRLSADANLGAAPNSFTANNIVMNGGTLITTSTVVLNGTRGIYLIGTGTFSPAAGTLLSYAGSNNQSNISGTGLLRMSGAGTFSLTAANTNTGGVTINNTNGTLLAGNAAALGASGNITVSAGTLALNLGGATLNNTGTITLNGAGVNNEGALFEAGTSGTDIVNNNIILASATGIGVITNGILELGASGVISSTSASALTINQSGTAGTLMIDSSANTYTGSTTINAGTVIISHLAPLSTASSLGAPISGTYGRITLGSAGNSATLTDRDTGPSSTSNRAINTAGIRGSGTFNWAGTNTLILTGGSNNMGTNGMTIATSNAGSLTVSGNITNTNGLDFKTATNTGNITVSGSISGTGAVTIDANTTSTVTLSNNNSYTGGTIINSGILRISADRNLGAVPGSFNATNLVFNGGTLQTTASFTLNAKRGIRLNNTGTFAPAASTTLTYAGTSGQSNISGSGDLRLNGAGTLSLTGANTFTGGITINNNGTLLASDINALSTMSTINVNASALALNFTGTLANTAAITLSNGATLSGTGMLTLSNAIILSGNTTTQTMTSTNSGSIITLNGTISGSSDLLLNGSGNILLGNSISANNLTINLSHVSVMLPTITLSGALNITSGGTITQYANTTITANSLIDSATGSIQLGNSGNNITQIISSMSSGGFALKDNGGLAINGALSDMTGNVTLTTGGTIIESNTGSINTNALTLSSIGGITLAGANTITSFTASNSGGGDIALSNTASLLSLSTLTQNNTGNINIINTGAMTSTAAITTTGGSVTFTTQSPDNNARILTIQNTITTQGGNIILVAANDANSSTEALVLDSTSTLNSGTGTGGTETIGGGIKLNGVLQVGSGNILLNGNGNDLEIGNFNANVNANFSVNRYLIIDGALTSTNGANLSLIGDQYNSGVGGVWIKNTGSVISGGTLTIQGSNLNGLNNANPTVGIEIDTGATVQSSQSMTLSENVGNSSIQINAPLQVTGNGSMTLTAAGTGSIQLGANLSTQGGAMTFNSPVTLIAPVSINTNNGNFTFAKNVSGRYTLTLNTGSGGNILFANNVNLANLLIVNTNIFNNYGITTASSFTQFAGNTDNLGDTLVVNHGNANITVTHLNGDIIVNDGNNIIHSTDVNANINVTGNVIIYTYSLKGNITANTLALSVMGPANFTGTIGGVSGAAAYKNIVFITPPIPGIQFFNGTAMENTIIHVPVPASLIFPPWIYNNSPSIVQASTGNANAGSYSSQNDRDEEGSTNSLNGILFTQAAAAAAAPLTANQLLKQLILNDINLNTILSPASISGGSGTYGSRLLGFGRSIGFRGIVGTDGLIARGMSYLLVTLGLLFASLMHTMREVISRRRFLEKEYVSSLSFNIRTHVNAILGFAGLMYNERLGHITPKQKEYAGDILASTQNMEKSVHTLLTTEPGTVPRDALPRIAFELRTALNNIIGFATVMKAEKVGKVTPALRETLSYILLSGMELSQLTLTLLPQEVNIWQALRQTTQAFMTKSQLVNRHFVAKFSFNLYTALNNIIGFSEMLEQNKIGPVTPQQKEYLHDISSSAKLLRDYLHQEIISVNTLSLAALEKITFQIRTSLMDIQGYSEWILAQKAGAISTENLEFYQYLFSSSQDVGKIVTQLHDYIEENTRKKSTVLYFY